MSLCLGTGSRRTLGLSARNFLHWKWLKLKEPSLNGLVFSWIVTATSWSIVTWWYYFPCIHKKKYSVDWSYFLCDFSFDPWIVLKVSYWNFLKVWCCWFLIWLWSETRLCKISVFDVYWDNCMAQHMVSFKWSHGIVPPGCIWLKQWLRTVSESMVSDSKPFQKLLGRSRLGHIKLSLL